MVGGSHHRTCHEVAHRVRQVVHLPKHGVGALLRLVVPRHGLVHTCAKVGDAKPGVGVSWRLNKSSNVLRLKCLVVESISLVLWYKTAGIHECSSPLWGIIGSDTSGFVREKKGYSTVHPMVQTLVFSMN